MNSKLPAELFIFLRDLQTNNNRAWFEANRARYHEHVRDPMLGFIAGFAGPLARISLHFRADPRPNGGSLFRIYRDTRFSRDKTPYKVNVGAHFRHEAGRSAHAPGFYLHLQPGRCFVACGIWRPEREPLGRIRDAIVDRTNEWVRIVEDPSFRKTFALGGESLKRSPRGYDPDHPRVEDLRRKDYVAVHPIGETDACHPDFSRQFQSILLDGSPLVRFLSEALGLPF